MVEGGPKCALCREVRISQGQAGRGMCEWSIIKILQVPGCQCNFWVFHLYACSQIQVSWKTLALLLMHLVTPTSTTAHALLWLRQVGAAADDGDGGGRLAPDGRAARRRAARQGPPAARRAARPARPPRLQTLLGLLYPS